MKKTDWMLTENHLRIKDKAYENLSIKEWRNLEQSEEERENKGQRLVNKRIKGSGRVTDGRMEKEDISKLNIRKRSVIITTGIFG